MSRTDTSSAASDERAAAEGRSHRTLSAGVRAVSGVTLLSRFGGMIRDVLLVRIFGDTVLGSAFAAGFQIPNLFRRLFGEGALSAAFIPEYTDARKNATGPGAGGSGDGVTEADRLASMTLIALGVVTTLLTIVGELALLVVLLVFRHDAERELSLRLVMVMLPFMPLICMVAILAGMLQVHGKFGASSTGPLFLNGCIIGVAGFLVLSGQAGGERTAYLLGAATVASGFTQLLWFLKLLRGHVRWTRELRGDGGAAVVRARRMLRKFVPVAIGLGTLQLSTFLDTVIAMWPNWVGPTVLGLEVPLDGATNSIVSAVQRLYQFPLGVFGIAVATAIFPLLARHADDGVVFVSTLRRGLRLSLFIGLPASVGLMLVRHDLNLLLYQGGKSGFSDGGIARADAVLLGYGAAVWAYSLNHVLTRAFYAKGDTRSPMRVSLVCMVLTFGLSLGLIWPLRDAGLAWAMAAGAVVQTVLLLVRARTMLGARVLDRPTLRGMGRVGLATGLMAVATFGVLWALPAPRGWAWELLRVAGGVGAGVVAYLGAARAMRVQELHWLLTRG